MIHIDQECLDAYKMIVDQAMQSISHLLASLWNDERYRQIFEICKEIVKSSALAGNQVVDVSNLILE
nr:hypothetical protein [Tanacetum cinerariifolium]